LFLLVFILIIPHTSYRVYHANVKEEEEGGTIPPQQG
jgi:hypothetical protein